MHLTKIAFWMIPALLIAGAVKVASDVPLWVAALIGLFSMLVNILVARVEDAEDSRESNPMPATLGRRFIRGSLRLAAVLIGVGALAIGVSTFGDTWPSPGWWGRYVAPIGMAVAGLYFLAYGITGRDKPFSKRSL